MRLHKKRTVQKQFLLHDILEFRWTGMIQRFLGTQVGQWVFIQRVNYANKWSAQTPLDLNSLKEKKLEKVF